MGTLSIYAPTHPEDAEESIENASPETPLLLRHLMAPGREKNVETFQGLIHCSRDPSQDWNTHFQSVLALVFEALHRENLRDMALATLQELILRQSEYFDQFGEVVAGKLFEVYNATPNDKLMYSAVERVMERLMSIMEPRRCIDILTPVVFSGDTPLLECAIRRISASLIRLSLAILNTSFLRPTSCLLFWKPSITFTLMFGKQLCFAS